MLSCAFRAPLQRSRHLPPLRRWAAKRGSGYRIQDPRSSLTPAYPSILICIPPVSSVSVSAHGVNVTTEPDIQPGRKKSMMLKVESSSSSCGTDDDDDDVTVSVDELNACIIDMTHEG